MSHDFSPTPADDALELDEDNASETTQRVAQAGRFYRVDSSRSTFRELWRDARSPLVVLVWLTKLLRVKLPGSVNDPNIASLSPFEVEDDSAFPEDARNKFAPVVRELTDLGFGLPLYFAINDLFHSSQTHQVVLLHRDGRSLARISHRVEGVQRPRTHFFVEFLSAFRDGTFLLSSSARSQMLPPPACELNWDSKATTSQLWVSHRQALEQRTRAGKTVIHIAGQDGMLDVVEQHHEHVRDFQLQRGVFSSMQGADLAQVEALDKNLDAASRGEMRYPEVMAQLERMQSKQTNWTSAFLILIVSIGLFIGAGAGAKWSWELVLMIVGILFVHEAGHFIAMKVFNYRNVRMFFIPFLGAAVSGQHYSAPGWKKVIVALMGPLPGILIGGVLGIIGIVKGNDLLVKVALLTIALNAFNLLPVLPLDGGRVMHAILFSRHHFLDAVFRVVAGGSLIGISLLAGDKFLMYLGIFMLIQVPGAYKLAKIATELRRVGIGAPAPTPQPFPFLPPMPGMMPPGGFAAQSGMPLYPVPPMTPMPQASGAPPMSPIGPMNSGPLRVNAPVVPPVEEHSIPQPVAETIIDRVKASFPRLKGAKQIAEQTLRIYETLATRPPGIAASIAFAALHGGAILLSIVLLAGLVLSQRTDLQQLARAAQFVPKNALTPASIETWTSPQRAASDQTAAAPTTGPNGHRVPQWITIIATLDSRKRASTMFDELKAGAPRNGSVLLFGQSVLLSLPVGDESTRAKWVSEFERRTKDVFVDSADTRTTLSLTCLAPDETRAEAIEKELNNYFNPPAQLYLIPPWTPEGFDRRTKTERDAHELARFTYGKLQRSGYNTYEDPEMKALNEKLARALRRGERAEHKELLEAQTALTTKLRLRALQNIRTGGDGTIDVALADRYIAIERDRIAETSRAATQPASQPSVADADTELTEALDPEFDNDYAHTAFARERAELGPLMGQLPLVDYRPSDNSSRFSHHWGSVSRTGLLISLHGVSFQDISDGAPALAQWLDDKECIQFKYELNSGSMFGDEYFD